MGCPRRLVRPLPAGLEVLLLSCLEKGARPPPPERARVRRAAAGLRRRGDRSEREARAWWARRALRPRAAPGGLEHGTYDAAALFSVQVA
jgi:hypothetical protein